MAKILIIEDDLAFGTMIQTWLRKPHRLVLP